MRPLPPLFLREFTGDDISGRWEDLEGVQMMDAYFIPRTDIPFDIRTMKNRETARRRLQR